MKARTKDYLKQRRKWIKQMIGKPCEDIRCGMIMDTERDMQVNHLVDRYHGDGINCGREGVRICHNEHYHKSIEDWHPSGRRTTPRERVEALRVRYGESAVEYYLEKCPLKPER